MKPVYLDYNATTPLDPRVFEAMRPYYQTKVGNAGSRTHAYGQEAKNAVERARAEIASSLGCEAREVVFTSGATESNNLVLLGLISHGMSTSRKHVLATCIEHKSVLEPLDKLCALGFEVELVPVTAGGYAEPDAVRHRLRRDTLLVTMMHANNETGVLQPVTEVAGLLADSGVLFHVDAAQTFGKQVDELKRLDCDFMSISGHKIYGPSGVGALIVRRRTSRRVPLTPIMYGGGQERGFRPGTLPVPLIVGLGAAAELARKEYRERAANAERLKRRLLMAVAAVDHRINGDLARTQSHVVNISFPGVDSEALMLALNSEIAISNGAACTSSGHAPSHVLRSMNLPDDQIASAVRFSWGPGVSEVPSAALVEAVLRLRW
ncbi:MAG TPA: aminotransferase class V-fold PLP-dependent enzyme [Isosphaeraceae bacterium]|nr:aminotransferase class V-fold PLP-dependent enzyme [Isosphaeraceae bacterium]